MESLDDRLISDLSDSMKSKSHLPESVDLSTDRIHDQVAAEIEKPPAFDQLMPEADKSCLTPTTEQIEEELQLGLMHLFRLAARQAPAPDKQNSELLTSRKQELQHFVN
jgi:hypothetical protein